MWLSNAVRSTRAGNRFASGVPTPCRGCDRCGCAVSAEVFGQSSRARAFREAFGGIGCAFRGGRLSRVGKVGSKGVSAAEAVGAEVGILTQKRREFYVACKSFEGEGRQQKAA